MTVFDLKKGETGVVERVDLSGGGAARLHALGLKIGTRVQILSFSLFKSSVLVAFGSVRLGIRRSLAQKIEVDK